jgi:hypothetical protein
VWLAYLLANAGLDPGNLDNDWGYAACLVAAAIAVVVTTGPQNLSRSGARIACPLLQDDDDAAHQAR